MCAMQPSPRRAVDAQAAPREDPSTPRLPSFPLTREEIEFIPVDDSPLEDAMLVAGVEGAGSVGGLIARYLALRLDMRLMGSFHSDRLPPFASIFEGVATAPIQVWRANRVCGPTGECGEILVLRNDLPLDPSTMMPLGGAIARFAAERDVKLLVGFSSYVPPRGAEDAALRLGSSLAGREVATHVDAVPLASALLYGFDAAILAAANREGLPAVILFTPSGDPIEPPTAAAEGLRRAAPMLPQLDLERVDLERELAEMHQSMLQDLEQMRRRQRLDRSLKGYA